MASIVQNIAIKISEILCKYFEKQSDDERRKLTEWVTVERGYIVAPENQRYMRVTAVHHAAVTLEDDKIYLSDYTTEVGKIVLAHIPLDGSGFITPANGGNHETK